MTDEISLVRKDDLEASLTEILRKEEEIVAQVSKLLPLTTEEGIRKEMENKLKSGLERIQALRLGYVPVATGGMWMVSTTTKSKWDKERLKGVLEEMPEEIKEAMNRAQELGIFKSIKVSTRSGPDPMVVGTTGKESFFIGAWLDLPLNRKIGVRILPRIRDDGLLRA
jgi:hypothetical protein